MSRRDESMVPEPAFRSYYGRPILKQPAWEWMVPAYLFTGGLSAGSAVLAAGADLSCRPRLRRVTSIGSLAALAASGYLLVADLGRPERFHHMLRIAKPTSPMSMGTWILTGFSPGVGVLATTEVLPAKVRRSRLGRLLRFVSHPAGVSSAVLAPALASYTAVLLSHTAVPAWNEAHRYLPFIFTGSAAAASGGLGMALAPAEEAGPARAFALYGGICEIAASRVMEQRLGLVGEAYHSAKPHRLRKWSEYLTIGGVLGTLLARRSRTAAVASGLALMAGSVLQRFGVYEAGVESTKDPKYVVVPQRQRLEARRATAP